MLQNRLFYLLLLLLVLSSCRFKPKEGLEWDQNLVAPLVKSRLSLSNAILDTNFVKTNTDNSLTVVYRDTLVDIALAEYLTVPDTSFSAKITLDSIQLATDTLDQIITLEDIAMALRDQGNAFGQYILDNDGNSLPGFPGANNLSSSDVPIDASLFFQEADLIQGKIVVEILNTLPVEITSVTFHLRNDTILTDTLMRRTIGPVPPGQMRSDSASLAGKTVVSKMAGKLENFDLAPLNSQFTIHLQDFIRLRIIVKEMRASRATAVFPAQRVIDDLSRIKYQFDNGLEIKKLKSKTGQLRLHAVSTLQDTLAFNYTLPTAIRAGQPVQVLGRLIPDLMGGSEANISFDLIDYYIDMTLNGDSINLFPYHLIGDLRYSGRLSTMDLSDSIDISYGLYDIQPSYIEGYLGKSTFNYQDTLKFDFFRSILGGSVSLEKPKVTLTVENSIGVDGALVVSRLEAFNSRTNAVIALTGQLMTGKTEVAGPKLPNVGQMITTPISIDHQNSNIESFLSVLPDEIRFDMDVLINENGNPGLRDNFATDESRISAYLDIEVPIFGVANQLWLQDTFALNVGETTLPKSIDEGKLKLVIENQFPFAANIQVLFLDHSGQVFDSLFTTNFGNVGAGQVNQNGYVDVPQKGTLTAPFDQNRFTQLKQRGAQAIFRMVLNTIPVGVPVKLYSTYGINFTLVGDFNYRLGS